MDTTGSSTPVVEAGSATPTAYSPSSTPNQQPAGQQEDCSILSPTLADILSDDRILRFYQCVKDIKTQGSPKQTAAMFFALCHALGDTVSFLKVPNMSKIMFRQEQQIFAVNVSGTQQDTVQFNQQQAPPPPPVIQQPMIHDQENNLMHDVDSTQSNNNIFAATTADGSPQHLLQAALSSVHGITADHIQQQQQQAVPAPATAIATTSTSKRKNAENKDGSKRAKKASPRDKEYSVRRDNVIEDLRKVSEADLLHQANIVDNEVKLIIQGHERATRFGILPPIQRFAAFANLPAHYDCDFAPKNAGVYYNYEYFQLYLAYRDLEAERQAQQQMEGGDPRPILVQCRADIEKVLVSTNWEAIRRRLTIGERICQVCGVVGRGFLLLSKQVSGRKLLHNFNTGEWGEFMREFQKIENQPLLQELQTKYSPERFYGPRQDLLLTAVADVAAAAAAYSANGSPLIAHTAPGSDNNGTTENNNNGVAGADSNQNVLSLEHVGTSTTTANQTSDTPDTIGAIATAVAAAVNAANAANAASSEAGTPTSSSAIDTTQMQLKQEQSPI